MNNKRRNSIRKIKESLSRLVNYLEELRDEEDEAYDNMPEQFQDSERGEIMQNAIEALDNAADWIQEAIDELDRIVD